MFKIVADSSGDMLEFSGAAFASVPLTISTAERTFTDDGDLDCHEMLDYMEAYKDRSYTACPSTEQWLRAFEGGGEVYVITLTSGLSGTYSSACTAADLYMEEHPDVRICVFDSLSTGPEIRLIAEKIAELKNEGKTFEEVKERIPAYQKRTHLYFAFQSLHNFAQNGRVNKVLAASISLLGISILGTASEEGTITPISKCRGEKKVTRLILKEMKAAGFTNGKIRISHVENEAFARSLAETLRSEYPRADILVYPVRGICSYYAERGGVIVGFEC